MRDKTKTIIDETIYYLNLAKEKELIYSRIYYKALASNEECIKYLEKRIDDGCGIVYPLPKDELNKKKDELVREFKNSALYNVIDGKSYMIIDKWVTVNQLGYQYIKEIMENIPIQNSSFVEFIHERQNIE